MKEAVKTIAIHLPQFHAIPENDLAWGKGFTEWTNVKKTRSLFKSHAQPRIPHERVGYYDLSSPSSLEKQAGLASEYGISGFAFYHYWFNGKRLLNLPVDNMLKHKTPDFPFCLFWANETWSRRWLGEEKEIIMRQEYDKTDHIRHADHLHLAFQDPRYIRIKERPLFIIYRPHDLPDAEQYIARFKERIVSHGENEPYLIASNSHHQHFDFRTIGFDGVLNFEPQLSALDGYMQDKWTLKKYLFNMRHGVWSGKYKIYDYNTAKDKMEQRTFDYPYYPCTFVGWDNTPRRGKNGIVMVNQNPERFKQSLLKCKEHLKTTKLDDNILFVNAWNEWAEGNYLEPDTLNGYDYLKVVKNVMS